MLSSHEEKLDCLVLQENKIIGNHYIKQNKWEYVFAYTETKCKYAYKMLFSDHCYRSMKNVGIHTNHHPFLLGCCLLFGFCHLGHTVTQFLLSVFSKSVQSFPLSGG